MPFEPIKKKCVAVGSVSLAPAGRNGTGLVVRLSADVAESTGLVPGRHVEVLAGTGADDGWLLARLASEGNRCFSPGRQAAQVAFSVPGISLGLSLGATQEVPHRITPDGLLIDIRPVRKPRIAAVEAA